MKTKLLTLLVASMAVIGIGLLPTVAAAEEAPPATQEAPTTTLPQGEAVSTNPLQVVPLDATCTGGNICYWSSINFEGNKFNIPCTGGLHELGGPQKESAINACANKAANLRHNFTLKACMNPGGERPNPGGFNEIFVFEEGSRC
jgi:hypothetical protein